MKHGRSIQEVVDQIEHDMETKRDLVADTRSLHMNSNGRSLLDVQGHGQFEVGDIAHEQIADRLNIPQRFYKRLRDEHPTLLDTNVNTLFQRKPEKRMVRTLGDGARAFLSDRYLPLDNFDVAERLLPSLQKFDGHIASCEVTESRMYLKATTPRLQADVGVNDVVQGGIVISNSEVGRGSLRVEMLMYRLVCTNGMVLPAKNADLSFTKTHLGRRIEQTGAYFRNETMQADDRAFWLKAEDVMCAMLHQSTFANIVQQFEATKDNIVDDEPEDVVEVVAERLRLPEPERKSVLRHWLQSQEQSQFGLVNAITRTAEDASTYDRATELERLGGDIMQRTPKQFAQLVALPKN